jgi:hypothetical protein
MKTPRREQVMKRKALVALLVIGAFVSVPGTASALTMDNKPIDQGMNEASHKAR